MIKAFCIDSNKSGDDVYIAGLENQSSQVLPVVYICKFEAYFSLIQVVQLSSTMNVTNIVKIRRFEGNNNFVVACNSHLMIYDIADKKIWKLMDVHNEDIVDFALCKDTIVTKGVGYGPFKMVKIDDSIKSLIE